MNQKPSILLYDGRKLAFRRAAAFFTYGLDDPIPVPLESEPVQALLASQFGYQPFIFALVDDQSIHVGGTAVRRALTARGVPTLLTVPFERLYSGYGTRFSRFIHGEAPAEIHGTFELHPTALAHLESIREAETQGI